jgi:hypothetical protein
MGRGKSANNKDNKMTKEPDCINNVKVIYPDTSLIPISENKEWIRKLKETFKDKRRDNKMSNKTAKKNSETDKLSAPYDECIYNTILAAYKKIKELDILTSAICLRGLIGLHVILNGEDRKEVQAALKKQGLYLNNHDVIVKLGKKRR